jgi:hypothetical protein
MSGQSGKVDVKDVGMNGWIAGIVRRVAVVLIRSGAAAEPSSAELRRKSTGVWGVFQAGRGDEIDESAGEDAYDAKHGGEEFECEKDGCTKGKHMKHAEPRGGSKRGECAEEKAEEENFAREPGAPPHLQGSPCVGRTAKVEDGDVEREDCECEDERERDGIGVVREQGYD